MNENENTTTQNIWDTATRVLRGKFMAIKVYHKKTRKILNKLFYLHLKELEKGKQSPKLVENMK